MVKKAQTMNLKGGEYAKVPERIRLFREACPNGLIETTPTIQADGSIIFKARVLKDKADQSSGEGIGHSFGKNDGDKAFEKLETIAVGRALAMLGYLASGEIASSEEMEDFYSYRNEKIEEAAGKLKACETIEELKSEFIALGSLMADEKIIKAKDERKAELLDESSKNRAEHKRMAGATQG